jgi:hypothetical protein
MVVNGPKSALELEGFASTRDANSRVDNPQVAAAISQIMQVLMGNEMTSLAIGPEQAIKVFNMASRIAGLPRDFELHVANRELIDKMMGKGGEQGQQEGNAQMQQMFGKLAEEILGASAEQSAEIVNYAITAVLTLYPGAGQETVLEASIAAAQAYAADMHSIGRDITRSGVFAALHQPGVQNVTLTSPAADVVIGWKQAAWCTAINVTIGGTDE